MPTLPGPTSQTPLLQAKFVVIKVGGGGGGDDFAAADAAPPRLAATSDPVISRALSGERMTASPGRGNGRCPCWPDAVRAPGRGPAEIPIRYGIRSGRQGSSAVPTRKPRPAIHAGK